MKDRRFAFIGPMGSGKSSLSRRAAAVFGGNAVDTDAEFVRRYGAIDKYFEEFGEASFRKIEEELMIEVANSDAKFIATGGGAVLSRPGMNAIKAHCDIVYVSAGSDILKERIRLSSRPLKNDLDNTLRIRTPLYEKYADYTIDSSVSSFPEFVKATLIPRKNRYDVILCDADETLLDFSRAKAYATAVAVQKLGIDRTAEEVDGAYGAVIKNVWGRLERGELDRNGLLKERVRLMNEILGTDIDADAYNNVYEDAMKDTRFVFDGAIDFLKNLKNRGIETYIITNSFRNVAEERLKPLLPYVSGYFISESIGYYKPNKRYFDAALEKINANKNRIIVFGDSVTSDIAGGIAAGLDTCLYDRSGKIESVADFTVRTYSDFLKIV